jgi:hypothetical protein
MIDITDPIVIVLIVLFVVAMALGLYNWLINQYLNEKLERLKSSMPARLAPQKSSVPNAE